MKPDRTLEPGTYVTTTVPVTLYGKTYPPGSHGKILVCLKDGSACRVQFETGTGDFWTYLAVDEFKVVE